MMMLMTDDILPSVNAVDYDKPFSNNQKWEFTMSNTAAIGAVISSEITDNTDNISQI